MLNNIIGYFQPIITVQNKSLDDAASTSIFGISRQYPTIDPK
jgi:hypothetical protein